MNKFKKFVQLVGLFFLFALPFLYLLFFYFQPLFATFEMAFQATVIEKISTSWNLIKRPIYFTFWQASLSTILTGIIGFPAAFMLAKFRFWGKSFLRLLITIPFIMPTVVVAAGFNALLGSKGWINLLLQSLFSLDHAPLQIMNTLGAILLAHVFYNSTVFIRVVSGAWSQLDPKLDYAAQSLGSPPWKVWLQITLPLLKPAIFSAIILVFLFNFTSFAVILLLGGPKFSTIEVEIYVQALQLFNLPLAGLLSAIQLLFTLVLSILNMRLTHIKTVQLTPRNPDVIVQPVRGWKQHLFVISMNALLIGLFVLPLLALLFRSVILIETKLVSQEITNYYRFSLIYYQELFLNRRQSLFYVPPVAAILNSLYFGFITVGIALLLGFLAARIISIRNFLGKILDPVLMLPLGTSAVTLGLGFVLVFNKPPLEVNTFPLLIPVAHSLVAIPFVVRILQPALLSFPKELIFASQTMGASSWRSFWRIEFPIISRAFISAALFAFTISMGEFGATTFLARPEYPTIPIAIYRYLSQPGGLNYGQAMAMSTILMIICTLSIYSIEKLKTPVINEF